MSIVTIQIPQVVMSGASLANQLGVGIRQRLSEMTLSLLKKDKLVTSNFSHRFDFRYGDVIKELGKLAKILDRNILKSAPHIEHSVSQATHPVVRYSGGSLILSGFTSEAYAALARYCRYVNYVLRKEGMPLKLNATGDPTDQDTEDIGLRIVIGCWVPYSTNVDWSSPNTDPEDSPDWQESGSYTEWLAAAGDAAVAAGRDRDAVYAHCALWDFDRIEIGATDPLPDGEQLHAFERVFFYMKTIINSSITLSRKFRYDASAFTCGSIPAPREEQPA